MKVGYARASSQGQKLEYQLDRLADCERVYAEKESGKKRDRPELARCLEFVREGDVLCVTKLDRLARSIRHLLEIVDTLEQKGATLEILDQNVDTATAVGRLLFGVLALISEFENEIRTERVRDGLAAARARGIHPGPTFKLTPQQIQELRERHAAGERISRLCRDYHLSDSSIYRYLDPNYAGAA